MTDHSVPGNLSLEYPYNAAGRDTSIHCIEENKLTFRSVKLEEVQIVDTKKSKGQNLNEKEERLAEEEASSDSLNVTGEVIYREEEVRKRGSAVADPHFPIQVNGYSAPDSGRSALARQAEIICWGVQELNHQRDHRYRASPVGSLQNLDLKTEGAQFLAGVNVERTNKEKRGTKRDSSTPIADTGRLVKGRIEGSWPAEDLSERRVHATIDDQTARAFHSILNSEYTEESTGARTIRQSGGKDRHSKVFTSKGPRDRRVRLSVSTAIQFYDVQDRLGYDQPSKAVDWLIKKAKSAIDELESLPTIGLQGFVASERDHVPPISRIQDPISGLSGLSACSYCTDALACNSNEGSITNHASTLFRSNVAIDISVESEGKGKDSPTRSSKQQAGDVKPPAEGPLIRSASGSNLILNEVQDMDCVSPVTNAKPELDTHHKFRGLDDRLKTQNIPGRFKLETSNNPEISGKHAKNSRCNSSRQGNFPYSNPEQNYQVFGDFSSMDDRAQSDARELGTEVHKLQDRESLDFSSSVLSKSLQLQEKFSFMADEGSPLGCLGMSQIWFQDEPNVNLPFSTTVSSAQVAQSHMQSLSSSTLPSRGFDHFQQLPSLPSLPLSQFMVRVQDPDVHRASTSHYVATDNNIFSPAATARAQQDNGISSRSLLHSLIMQSPETMYDFGYQTSANGSAGEANKLVSAQHPGHLMGPFLTPRFSHAENPEVYPLLPSVTMLEDELLSSSRITSENHNLFRSVSGRLPIKSFPGTGLNTRNLQAVNATDPNVVSATPTISRRVQGLHKFKGGGQETL